MGSAASSAGQELATSSAEQDSAASLAEQALADLDSVDLLARSVAPPPSKVPTASMAAKLSTAPSIASWKTRVEERAGVWQIRSGSDISPYCAGDEGEDEDEEDQWVALHPLMTTRETQKEKSSCWVQYGLWILSCFCF